MKNILFVIKVGIISVILYYLLLIFIVQPFIMGTLFSQENLGEDLFPYAYKIISALLFVGVCWGVVFLLKKPAVKIEVTTDTGSVLSPGKPDFWAWGWAVVLSLATITVPQFSVQQMPGIVYLFTLPLLVICWIILNLMQAKYKNTGSNSVKTSMYLVLTIWTLIVAFIYQQLF